MASTHNRDRVICPCCGQQLLIDNEKNEIIITKNINVNKNINHSSRTIDDAAVIRAQTEMIRVKAKAREKRIGWLVPLICFGFAILMVLVLYSMI